MPGTAPARTRPFNGFDAIVVGGGVIGLAIAWRAAGRGLRVAVADPDPGSGASHAAAGMLAPVAEAHFGEERLLALNLASARLYPAFAAEVEEAAGTPSGYSEHGTLAVAFDRDDKAALERLADYHRRLGSDCELLSGAQCRELEPLLAAEVQAGLHVPGDHQIDNRLLVAALLGACARAGVSMYRERVTELVVERSAAAGVRLASGERLSAERVIVAAGCWSNSIPGLPSGVLPPIRPVKGQILRLSVPAQEAPFLGRAVRGIVRGRSVYLVPREHGELVVGATSEELGFDTQVTAGGVYELLRDARTIVPGITELPLVEATAGLRPGSPDNAPVIGPTALSGLIAATGHFRNGILLTPVTAGAIAQLLAEGTLPPEAQGFGPERFAGTAAEAAGARIRPQRTEDQLTGDQLKAPTAQRASGGAA